LTTNVQHLDTSVKRFRNGGPDKKLSSILTVALWAAFGCLAFSVFASNIVSSPLIVVIAILGAIVGGGIPFLLKLVP
jgi:hypothetical protein